jgi:hypothetical protein
MTIRDNINQYPSANNQLAWHQVRDCAKHSKSQNLVSSMCKANAALHIHTPVTSKKTFREAKLRSASIPRCNSDGTNPHLPDSCRKTLRRKALLNNLIARQTKQHRRTEESRNSPQILDQAERPVA